MQNMEYCIISKDQKGREAMKEADYGYDNDYGDSGDVHGVDRIRKEEKIG